MAQSRIKIDSLDLIKMIYTCTYGIALGGGQSCSSGIFNGRSTSTSLSLRSISLAQRLSKDRRTADDGHIQGWV
eukprot:s123_g21.t1